MGSTTLLQRWVFVASDGLGGVSGPGSDQCSVWGYYRIPVYLPAILLIHHL